MENYRRALENKIDDLNELVAETDMIQNKANIGRKLLGEVKHKQTRMINEFIKRHNTLFKKYELKCEQMNTLCEKNGRLQFNKRQLNNKLNEQEALIKKFNSTHSTLEKDAHTLQYKLSRIKATIDNLKDMQRQKEMKLNDMDQEIVCTKDIIADKIAQRIKVENQIDVEWTKYTSLQASKFDIIIENDQDIRSLRTKIDTVRNKLDDKMLELANIKRCFNKAQRQCDIQNEQLKELKSNIHLLQSINEKKNCNALKQITSLQVNVKSLTTKYKLINTNTIYDAQIENGKLKLKLEDQNITLKALIINKEHLQQEVERNKQAIELAQQKLLTERKQQVNEIKLHKSKLLLKDQEKCEIRKLIKDQDRQIKRLEMENGCHKPDYGSSH